MSWMLDTQQLAVDAAANYYDNVLLRGKYTGDFNRLPKDREAAIRQLAKENVSKLRQIIPEDSYNEDLARRVAALDVGAVSKYMYEYGENPFSATRKADLSSITGDEGKRSWYDMDPKEIDSQMYRFGYDPAIPGDRQKFLREVADYQKSRDRGQIVRETVEEAPWYLKLGYATVPTTTNEAVKQSLTGEFDDRKKWTALGLDFAAGAGMGATANTGRLVANPLYVGLADAGIEAARQGLAYGLNDAEVDPVAPFTAGMTAATVPTIATGIRGYLSRGGSTEARPLARGFLRGALGADDPNVAERNALKDLLMKARKQSIDAQEQASVTDNPGGNLYGAGELEMGRTWQNAADKLNALGFYEKRIKDNLDEDLFIANNKVKAAKLKLSEAQRQPVPKDPVAKVDHDGNLRLLNEDLETALKEQQSANDALDSFYGKTPTVMYDAELAYRDGSKFPMPTTAESVIGRNPSYVKGGPVRVVATPDERVVDEVLNVAYDAPLKYPTLSNTSIPTPEEYESVANALGLLKTNFPAKYERELATGLGSNARTAYNMGLIAGRGIGTFGTAVEPNVKINLMQPQTYDQKTKEFKNSDWYKNLPANKKNAIEKALKGE